MLPSRGGVGCSRISESGLLGTRNRPIQPTTRTAMNYKISTKSSYCTCKTIVRVSRSAYPLGPLYPPPGFGVSPTVHRPTRHRAIPMAIPYPVHIGRLRCIVTGCAGRSRYCEFLHTDTHTSITEHWCARARSLPYSPHTLSPLSSATWHARITARAARSQPGRPSHSTLSSLSSAMRHAHTHQCAHALLLGLLVDLCYLYDRPYKDQPSEPGALHAHLDMLLTYSDFMRSAAPQTNPQGGGGRLVRKKPIPVSD